MRATKTFGLGGALAAIHATCNWQNISAVPVTFGTSFSNELCMDVLHYAPSQGAFVCLHTQQGGGVDVCCPSAASACASLF